MKKIALLIFYCLLQICACYSQSINWQWARGLNGRGGQIGSAIAVNSSGVIYSTGSYDSCLVFGTDTLCNAGINTLFIAKYDGQGNLLSGISGDQHSGESSGNALTIDKNDNVLVTGWFLADSVRFGNTELYSPERFGFFTAKYDSSGNVLWAKGGWCNKSIEGNAVVTDEHGNAYVTGTFTGDSATIGSTVLHNNPADNASGMFIVKYDSAGNIIWVKGPAGNENNALGNAIAYDGLGHIYVTGGAYGDSIRFDSITLHLAYMGLYPIGCAIILKYDTDGNILWGINSEGVTTSNALGSGVTTDNNKNVIVTGAFSSGKLSIGSQHLSNTNPYQAFITKLDSSGNLLWLKQNGGSGYYYGYGVATDINNNIYLTGSCSGDSVTFDTINATLKGAPYFPMFIATFDALGNAQNLTMLTSGGFSQNAVCTDRLGNAYITGDYMTDQFFVVGSDSFAVTDSLLWYAFVARIGDAMPTAIKPVPTNIGFNLYPNPFTGSATVTYNLSEDLKDGGLIIYNLLGQPCATYKLSSNIGEIQINRNHLSSGVYFCSLVVNDKVVETKKMVVE